MLLRQWCLFGVLLHEFCCSLSDTFLVSCSGEGYMPFRPSCLQWRGPQESSCWKQTPTSYTAGKHSPVSQLVHVLGIHSWFVFHIGTLHLGTCVVNTNHN